MQVKTCARCDTEKPISDFYKMHRGRFGVRGQCKKCCNELQREQYRVTPEQIQRSRATRRGWGEAHREQEQERERKRWASMSLSERQEARQRRNPIKERARRAVQYAVKSGRLARPNSCSKCGVVKPIHGHHDDYNKPLDVKWLCATCHGKRHRELFDEAAAKERE